MKHLMQQWAWSAAVCAALAVPSYAQDQKQESPPPENGTAAKDKITNRERLTGARKNGSKPLKRSSELIGMEIVNHENEPLGRVKDFLLDMENGRVSFAILSIGAFQGSGEKLVAVPSLLLRFDESGRHVVLPTDKEKLQGAPSFTSDEWPELTSSIFGSAGDYWRKDRNGAQQEREQQNGEQQRP